MRRSDREIDDLKLIEEIMSSAHICRVAFHDVDYPYIFPMNFGYKNNKIYFHCSPKGKKIDLLKRNNKVCFEVELDHEIITGSESCDWTTKFRSVIGYGKIEIIENVEEKKNALDILMIQHGKSDNEYIPKMLERVGVLRLNIETFSGKQAGEW